MELTKEQVQIRKANRDDILAMSCLWENLVLEENPEAKPNKEMWREQQKTYMMSDAYHPYVVVSNNLVVGFATGFAKIDLENGEQYLEGGHMYISPMYRKGKAGRMIHKMSIEVSKKIGARFFRRYVSAANERMMRRLTIKKYVIKGYLIDEEV